MGDSTNAQFTFKPKKKQPFDCFFEYSSLSPFLCMQLKAKYYISVQNQFKQCRIFIRDRAVIFKRHYGVFACSYCLKNI